MAYVTTTHLLERIHPKTMVVNDPAEVRNAPEKLFVMDFPQLMPETLITRDAATIRAFRKEFGDIVMKPLYGNGGQGVFRVKPEDNASPNATAQVDADNVPELVALIKQVQPKLVINVALPYQDLHIMDACLETGVDYLDTANYEPLDTAHFEYSWQWAYQERFKQAGIMALLGSGFDPGVTNVYTALAAKKYLDVVEELDIIDANAGYHGQPFATNFNPAGAPVPPQEGHAPLTGDRRPRRRSACSARSSSSEPPPPERAARFGIRGDRRLPGSRRVVDRRSRRVPRRPARLAGEARRRHRRLRPALRPLLVRLLRQPEERLRLGHRLARRAGHRRPATARADPPDAREWAAAGRRHRPLRAGARVADG